MSRAPVRPLVAGVGVAAYAVAAGMLVGLLLDAGTDPVAVVLLGALAVAGLVAGTARYLHQRDEVLVRVAEGTELAAAANPAHRLPAGPAGPLAEVTSAVNRLAEQREAALREAERTAESLRREVESERNRLAALMARLGVAVVVCNAEGRILLYNETARALVDDPALLGLGRTVFRLVDRGLVAHARQRLESGDRTYTATTVHRGRMLRVHVAPVHEVDESVTGLVLVLEDRTREDAVAGERQAVLRRLTEQTRASLGSIRAAAETVLEYPDLPDADRRRFLEVVREESDRLGRRLDDASTDVRPAGERGLDDISGSDLLSVVGDRLRDAGLACRDQTSPATGNVWVRADPHALGAVLTAVSDHLGGSALGAAALSLTSVEGHVRLDLRWSGRPPAPADLLTWLDEPLGEGAATTAGDVVERHAAEIWAGADGPGAAHLTVLLPGAPDAATDRPDTGGPERGHAGPAGSPATGPGSRPEFYDFDLLTASTVEAERSDRLLEELTFTVLDTETTGLDPDGGDRVVSLGAVRVVNGRVLRQETFEQLVNPGRRVPPASTAIHGLTDAMLADAPALEDVLPGLARFAEDTVLVGHDIGFDLRFLTGPAKATGVDLDHPVLDTLLLDAALYPAQPDHTLEAIAERLGVSVVGRHTALGDALVTADVLVGLLGALREAGVRTLAEALTASRRTFRRRAEDEPERA